jgi:hypothetical protein
MGLPCGPALRLAEFALPAAARATGIEPVSLVEKTAAGPLCQTRVAPMGEMPPPFWLWEELRCALTCPSDVADLELERNHTWGRHTYDSTHPLTARSGLGSTPESGAAPKTEMRDRVDIGRCVMAQSSAHLEGLLKMSLLSAGLWMAYPVCAGISAKEPVAPRKEGL